jgi:hypothetical protein
MKSIFRKVAITAIAVLTMSVAVHAQGKGDMAAGGGIDYQLTDKLIFNAELKYKLGNTWDRLLISAGMAYRF